MMHTCASVTHMRTTLNIDDELHARLKQLAASSGRTLTEVLEDAIRGHLQDVAAATDEAPPAFPVFDGGNRPGVLAGVDLDDNAAVLDLLDGDSGAPA